MITVVTAEAGRDGRGSAGTVADAGGALRDNGAARAGASVRLDMLNVAKVGTME